MPTSFDNSFARLPERFYARQRPTPVARPSLVRANPALAEEIGVAAETLDPEVLSGNRLPDGADPIALAYAGHQFGHFVPQLGDGRAILLGEVVGPDGIRRDLQLKGSGPTAFSRNGDGRAAIGPAIREYVVSEAMAALGIPTTRALAVVTTGEQVARETVLPGAIFTRVAESHIRVGTFEYHAARKDLEALRLLTDHVIARHFPEAAQADDPALALLEGVIARQATLVARWMQVGFIHGVMNTDNTSIAGETIDYGPCAFMDSYHPACVFSSIDRQGRYAWGRQPAIAHWNLLQLAQCLLPLLSGEADHAQEAAQDALDAFPEHFSKAHLRGFARKLGLLEEHPDDPALVDDLLQLLAEEEVDFTLFFRRLTQDVAGGEDAAANSLFQDPGAFEEWSRRWRARGAQESSGPSLATMQAANPVFIPRNHRLEEVIAAANRGDFAPFEKLLAVLSRPYDEQPEHAEYENPPEPHEVVHATFCGT